MQITYQIRNNTFKFTFLILYSLFTQMAHGGSPNKLACFETNKVIKNQDMICDVSFGNLIIKKVKNKIALFSFKKIGKLTKILTDLDFNNAFFLQNEVIIIDNRRYLFVVATRPSFPQLNNSKSYCGAGEEVSLIIIEYSNKIFKIGTEKLIESCINSYYLSSNIYESIKIDNKLITIDWESGPNKIADKKEKGLINLENYKFTTSLIYE